MFSTNRRRLGSLFDFSLAVQQGCPSQRRQPNRPILPPIRLHPTPVHCTIIHSRFGPNPEGLPRKRHGLKVAQIHQLVIRNQKWERRSKRMSPLKHPHQPRLPPSIRSKIDHTPTERRAFSSKKEGRHTFFDRHCWLYNYRSSSQAPNAQLLSRKLGDACQTPFFLLFLFKVFLAEKHGSIACLVTFHLTTFAILCRHIMSFQSDHL